MTTLLTTERLLVRDWEASDAPAALAIFGDERVSRWLTPAVEPVPDEEGMSALLDTWRHDSQAVEQGPEVFVGRWALVRAEDEAVVGALDGLVVTGGADVSPHLYAAEPHERTQSWREDRDAWEVALLAAAGTRRVPVLGICRGMQVMAVAAGGRLEQHVPDRVGHENHSPGGDVFGEVAVEVAASSRVHDLVGDRLTVRCHHHQGVLEHPGYEPVAWASDGTLEAMEQPGDRFEVAVQWHPEMVADAGLFRGLVDAARVVAPAVGGRPASGVSDPA